MSRKQDGAAIVEFALLLPFLIIISLLATEYGRALHEYNILTKSVRDAARYLTTYAYGDTTKYPTAKNLIVYGNPAGSGSPLVLGLTTSMVPNPVWQTISNAPVVRVVTVQVGTGAAGSATRFKFVPIMASVFGLNFLSIEFAPITVTMRE